MYYFGKKGNILANTSICKTAIKLVQKNLGLTFDLALLGAPLNSSSFGFSFSVVSLSVSGGKFDVLSYGFLKKVTLSKIDLTTLRITICEHCSQKTPILLHNYLIYMYTISYYICSLIHLAHGEWMCFD